MKNDITIADYFNRYQEINSSKVSDENRIRIALLSSFTLKGLKEVLSVKCFDLGIKVDFYIGGYNQYYQEILNEEGGLYQFNPDVIIIFIDSRTLLGNQYLMPYQISSEQRKIWANEKLREIESLIRQVKNKSSAKIILHNFEVPTHSPLGICENKEEFGLIETVETLNGNLRSTFKLDGQVFIFDYNNFCSKIGKVNIFDHKMYYLGDMKLDLQNIPKLCDEYLAYIKLLKSLNKKCIVLDLDNTLWGGIIGEDGLEGIKLGPTPEGRPFFEFQQYLLSLFNRGVILAINSKNNLDDALEVLRKHPYMVLKEEHFANIKINWGDKISNMKAIAKELNIGIDSLVFIDDDKLNREMVKDALPEILTIDLPEDPALYLKILMEINDFNTLQITEEDKQRGKLYAEQRQRAELQQSITDITKYLRALKMVVTIQQANHFNIPRIAQLTQKTNQFNMTTRRYTEEEIKKMANDDKYLIVSIKVEDKFGDNGITGVIIVEKQNYAWRIDNYLLSCRIIGRRVEEVFLSYIIKRAKKEKAKILSGEFITTKKNAPAKNFYKDNAFTLVKKAENSELWEYNLKRPYKTPEFIRVIEK